MKRKRMKKGIRRKEVEVRKEGREEKVIGGQADRTIVD